METVDVKPIEPTTKDIKRDLVRLYIEAANTKNTFYAALHKAEALAGTIKDLEDLYGIENLPVELKLDTVKDELIAGVKDITDRLAFIEDFVVSSKELAAQLKEDFTDDEEMPEEEWDYSEWDDPVEDERFEEVDFSDVDEWDNLDWDEPEDIAVDIDADIVEEDYTGLPEERTTHLEYVDEDPADGKAVLPKNISKE